MVNALAMKKCFEPDLSSPYFGPATHAFTQHCHVCYSANIQGRNIRQFLERAVSLKLYVSCNFFVEKVKFFVKGGYLSAKVRPGLRVTVSLGSMRYS